MASSIWSTPPRKPSASEPGVGEVVGLGVGVWVRLYPRSS
jgi:hypothetical protein